MKEEIVRKVLVKVNVSVDEGIAPLVHFFNKLDNILTLSSYQGTDEKSHHISIFLIQKALFPCWN